MDERNLDFDRIIDRRNTRCLKYDHAVKRGYPADVLPLWVADMDFSTSSYVEDALEKVVHHNIYGYSNIQPGDGFFEAVSGWMKRHHNWDVDRNWHVMTPGVCFGMAVAIRAFTDPGDAVLIQQPVYYPFKNIIKDNGRKVVSSDLVCGSDGKWVIDFDDFENSIIADNIKLFLLCNPHNPVGRVWSADELKTLGNICKKHNVRVFSDEIHFEFIREGEHSVFQELDDGFKNFTITATSPSKTFNLAGLQQSNLFIPDKDMYRSFTEELARTAYDEPNIFGMEAAQAAYENGDEWFTAVSTYINDNIRAACEYVNKNFPQAKLRSPEGMYLIWLDLNGTGKDAKSIDDIIVNKAKVWLDSGMIFGRAGEGFQRINAACPRSVLMEALERIQRAFEY